MSAATTIDEELKVEHEIIQSLVDARKANGLTQKQLAEKTGITQSDISKLENGGANPSLRTLRRLAAALGMRVKIEFVAR
ncbi:helix-turn-helix domain-containing protein [Synergistes jonesii]|uniref:helix-turn-helix domain-containing protein n=1 Tax=Synergistes jonesii TaxID=2754 RepID=UPI00242E6C2B|nr:helix-turn-helix transcriptional regulator [Synergistes jonesii]MDY2984856.1 helix-turn-helix transcriptional regulator [Synergistes jonesii]